MESNKGTLTQMAEDVFELDFGNVRKGTDLKTEVALDLSTIGIRTSCGCTAADYTSKDGKTNITINYDSNKTGLISQRVTLILGNQLEVLINLKGQINEL